MSRPEFSKLFMEEFVPILEVKQLTSEFIALRQTMKFVNEINALLYENSMYFPDYVATKALMMPKYSTMLKD